MASRVRFNSNDSTAFLEALAEGRSIAPPAEGWTVGAALMLAAACQMSAAAAVAAQRDVSKLPLEHREAHGEQVRRDTFAAVEWLFECTRRLLRGEHDPSHEVVNVRSDRGRTEVLPVESEKAQER